MARVPIILCQLIQEPNCKRNTAGKFGGRKLWRIYRDTILARESLANLSSQLNKFVLKCCSFAKLSCYIYGKWNFDYVRSTLLMRSLLEERLRERNIFFGRYRSRYHDGNEFSCKKVTVRCKQWIHPSSDTPQDRLRISLFCCCRMTNSQLLLYDNHLRISRHWHSIIIIIINFYQLGTVIVGS